MQELTLNKPVRAHGETISVLEFSEPTGKDVRELGFPYKLDSDQSILLNAVVITKYIQRLANVPPSTVDEMSPSDLNSASWLVAGFFLQA
ncbi:phage tail assembly protein [Citrobacter sp. RHB25-C09]|uniref:phage tail assembly protein n=1 Tax=Citrobacter TaxID=544 RepID=UPI0015EF173D|nr:phage tail assembly protein [Citrobacter sp. RHB25-C09]QMI05816.1 phage tail assembly protein [Citrobacter sp. RHB25-C09]